MTNEVLFIATLAVNFLGIVIVYKKFGKLGIFAWIGFATVASNIEVAKCVDMFGLSVTLGNVVYATTFLATDVLSETEGGKEARKGVWIGFFTLIFFTIISQINLLFIPNEQDMVSGAMEQIFSFMPRICFSSILAYLISNMLDTYLYQKIKELAPKQMWLRNNGATMISQLVDSSLFTILVFAGTMSAKEITELIITTYVVKVFVALCDTPFLYIMVKGEKNERKELNSTSA